MHSFVAERHLSDVMMVITPAPSSYGASELISPSDPALWVQWAKEVDHTIPIVLVITPAHVRIDTKDYIQCELYKGPGNTEMAWSTVTLRLTMHPWFRILL